MVMLIVRSTQERELMNKIRKAVKEATKPSLIDKLKLTLGFSIPEKMRTLGPFYSDCYIEGLQHFENNLCQKTNAKEIRLRYKQPILDKDFTIFQGEIHGDSLDRYYLDITTPRRAPKKGFLQSLGFV